MPLCGAWPTNISTSRCLDFTLQCRSLGEELTMVTSEGWMNEDSLSGLTSISKLTKREQPKEQSASAADEATKMPPPMVMFSLLCLVS